MKNSPNILPIIVLFTLASCGVYMPQSADIPLINKKNDLRIDAGVASALKAGTSTISYGLTNKITIQAYGTLGSNSRYYYQGAIGYYKSLKNRNVLELYVGAGNGYAYFSNHDEPSETSGNYQVYFTQLNYGKLGGEESIWDIGFGIKTGLIHTDLVKNTSTDEYSLPGFISESFIGNSLLIEPTIFTRVGGKHLKLNIKLGGLYINKAVSSGISYFPLNLSVGLNYSL